MIDEIKNNTYHRMEKIIEILKNQLNTIHTGRASPNLLKGIKIEYYGKRISLSNIAHITVENSQTLIINPFDSNLIQECEKAIIKSNLGFNPCIKNNIIQLKLPSLTEERRKKLIKIIRKNAEDSRISIRNIRRETNNQIKKLIKIKMINEDKKGFTQNLIQKLTDQYIANIDTILKKKENELLTF